MYNNMIWSVYQNLGIPKRRVVPIFRMCLENDSTSALKLKVEKGR